MQESDLRAEVGNALQRLRYWTMPSRNVVVCPKCNTKVYPQSGRPDLMFWDWQGPVGFIEVKRFPRPAQGKEWAQTSFSLSRIEPEQRAWLLVAQSRGARHLYIALGDVHGRAGAKSNRRVMYIVPWGYWLNTESKLLPIQKSLPLATRPGLRKEIQHRNLVATCLFKDYELNWVDGGWQFRENHPIRQSRPLLHERDLKTMREEWAQTREEQRALWKTKALTR